jgi:chromosome segregation ATPase
MNPHRISPSSLPSVTAADLEITAELPVLDDAGYATENDQQARTDSWPVAATENAIPIVAADAEAAQQFDSDSQAVSAQVREIQDRLANKNERLRQLENDYADERVGRGAAERRAADLRAELEQLQAAATQSAAQLAELTQTRTVAEERATRLADELAQARSAAEQRAAQLNEELAQALFLASSASTRATQLEQAHEAQQRASLEQQARELAARETLAARERASSERITAELQAERARSTAYFEALRTAEGRRSICEELVVDLQHEVQTRAADLAALEGKLAAQHAQVRELQAELAQRAAHKTRLEQQVSSFTTSLDQRDTQLREARHESQELQQGFSRLQTEFAASTERERAFAALAEQHHGAVARQQGELQRLEAERAELKAALESARTAAVASTEQLATQQAALASARERTAQLEAALATGQERGGQLESELARVRGEMEDWGTALGNAQRERDGHLAAIAAGEARVREIEQQALLQTAAMGALRAQTDAGAARVGELEGELRASGEAVSRLESEAHSREARIAELEKATQMWRAALEEMRLNSGDSRPRPALRNVVPRAGDDEPSAHAEPLSDGAMRLLIQTAGGREIVHVLGRRTCIGRTPENDIRIDSTCVSRRHAVILTGSRQTVIEDLNSTNGVLVNGKRVTRQILKDGDDVVFGRSRYRFAVRRASENH